jgi:hypothetical protein
MGGHSMIEYYISDASPVFKNVIIDELVERSTSFEGVLSQIFEWAGFRIKVKRVFLEMKGYYYNLERIQRLHEALTGRKISVKRKLYRSFL